MSAPMLSSLWYRVAELRPKLRAHARLYRHVYRGQVWYLLQDPATGRVNRFTAAARMLIVAMDGTRTVADLWEAANRRLGEDAPTQDEVIQLLGQLHAGDLLQSDVSPDAAELFTRHTREERARARRSYANPMAIRIPLWDPDRFLDRIGGLSRLVWSRWGLIAWLAAVLPALLLVPSHWPELTQDLSDRVLALDNLVVIWLVFPVIKALHEMGHATATKAGGGEVHDIGVMLLVLLPVPYVEASAASVFPSKHQRAMVGAAGIAVELFVAALAFYVWLGIEPGPARAVLFNVMLIASVSTLLFNGNPLLRYDAYYVLADLTEIPNLAARSMRHWGWVIDRYLLGARDAQPPEASRGERVWFLFYGAASSIYRVLVTVTIALFIAGRFFFVGVLLALWAVASMALLPLVRAIRHVASGERLRRNRRRATLTLAGGALVLAVFLLAVPMPSHTHAEGVVWLPEQALVRAGASGFLGPFDVRPGEVVSLSERLGAASDPALAAQLRIGEARIAELEATYAAEAVADRGKARITAEKLAHERTAVTLLRERVDDLVVRARADGVFMAPQIEDLLGKYVRKGELLGYVVGRSPPIARVVVPQDAVDRVRLTSERVRVRTSDRPDLVREGHIARVVPGGEEFLPSRALAVEGGGEIATDPRETRGAKSLARMFQLDVEMAPLEADTAGAAQFGQRVYVRFEHAPEPLSEQWYRALRQMFLSRFGV